jgi:hypothetical protein
MFARIPSRLLIALLLIAASFTSAATILNAKEESSPKDRFVVHEWGTFTSVSDASGKAQTWSPLLGPSDLPDFVYRSKQVRSNSQERCLKCELALVRMETPVLYFYADHETKASVKVDFPQGRITEWFPQAREADRSINWGEFTVLPGAQATFPVSKGESHYYPARETDAAPIRLSRESKTEHEKFLFYRGIGNFSLPLKVRLAGNQVTVRNAGQCELAQIILFENRGGRIGWQVLDLLKGEATLTRPTLNQPIESLHSELEKLLVAQGLYQKEAAAMVKTWRDSWFEEGLRVFYIVPRAATDAILPITITPAPTELARVLVGRTEIITPELEAAVQSSARKYLEGSAESRATAIKMVQPYGRFAQPVLQQMMEAEHKIGGARASQPIWDFMYAAGTR